MIISHTQKVIFVKTRKVGGTSLEVALSAFCGEDCVITQINEAGQALRREKGYKSAQNFENTIWPDGYVTQGSFYNHVAAAVIKDSIPVEIWNTYKKFSIHRNPFEAAISQYFALKKKSPDLIFEKFVTESSHLFARNNQIAPLQGEAKVDYFVRYEHYQEDLEKIGLGYLWPIFAETQIRGEDRPKTGTSVAEMFASCPAGVTAIARVCAEEISYFGYAVPEVE